MPSQNDPSKPALQILPLFDNFTTERRYLRNASPKTLESYRCSWRAFRDYLIPATDEAGLRTAARQAVMAIAESGTLNPTSINDYSRCLAHARENGKQLGRLESLSKKLWFE